MCAHIRLVGHREGNVVKFLNRSRLRRRCCCFDIRLGDCGRLGSDRLGGLNVLTNVVLVAGDGCNTEWSVSANRSRVESGKAVNVSRVQSLLQSGDCWREERRVVEFDDVRYLGRRRQECRTSDVSSMGMRRRRSILGVRGQVETPQSERAVALSDEDGLTLVVDKDMSIVEVGAATCITELADGQETVVLEFWEKVNLSSSRRQHGQVELAFMGRPHDCAIGTFNGKWSSRFLLVLDWQVQQTEVGCYDQGEQSDRHRQFGPIFH